MVQLEQLGIIGDLHTAALVGIDGSINWLCLPRFDREACFAALLGTDDNGHWRLAPAVPAVSTVQRYRPGTLILETEFATAEGVVRVIDFMPPESGRHDVVRIVEGVQGRVTMAMDLVIRFNYGERIPWVRHTEEGIKAIAGPDALLLRCAIETEGRGLSTCGTFLLEAGQQQAFVVTWFPAHEPPPGALDATTALAETQRFWEDWSARCTYEGPWREAVLRSLVTLKALTFAPTGGILAAATTSLPEQPGGVRNWDYRFCWLRDATFTLYALMHAGYTAEASAWSEWLLRAVAGEPAQLHILYGAAGERVPAEIELSHLTGYEGARPVRVGNSAARQFQLDVYGEVMDALQLKREIGLPSSAEAWRVQRHLVDFVATHWSEPDEGIWEVRGPRRHFTHSKAMAWVALDRAVKAVERFQLDGDLAGWRELRQRIHDDVCARGYNAERGTFTQSYGSDRLDASLLLLPLVGFLPADDPRMARTITAIRDELMIGGLVYRYAAEESAAVDGLPPGEGAFLPCSFWLVDCLCLLGRQDEARVLFERLLTLRTPLGLLAEEYEPRTGRLLGNFPQALSHVALVNSAQNLSARAKPAAERSAGAQISVKSSEPIHSPRT